MTSMRRIVSCLWLTAMIAGGVAHAEVRFEGRCGAYLYGSDAKMSTFYRAQWADERVRVELSLPGRAQVERFEHKYVRPNAGATKIWPPSDFMSTPSGFTWWLDDDIIEFDASKRLLEVRRHETKWLNDRHATVRITGQQQPNLVTRRPYGLVQPLAGGVILHVHPLTPILYKERLTFDVVAAVSDEKGEPQYALSAQNNVYVKRDRDWREVRLLDPLEPGASLAIFPGEREVDAWVLSFRVDAGRGLLWKPHGKLANGMMLRGAPPGWPVGREVRDFVIDPASGKFLWWYVSNRGADRDLFAIQPAVLRGLRNLVSTGGVRLLSVAADQSSALVAHTSTTGDVSVRLVLLTGKRAGVVEDVCREKAKLRQ